MAVKIGGIRYVPGMYDQKRPAGAQLANMYFRNLDKKLVEKEKMKKRPEVFPTICFSRKIGVGALEVADLIAGKTGYSVADRELMEYVAKRANLSEKAVACFDERYPGKREEIIRYLFGEKSFIKSDYSRNLFSSVISMASLTPTIFVGRGTHLILPRNRTFAVRLICSDTYRINRLAKILAIKEEEAKDKLKKIDKEQRAFFKKTFGKKDASPYEFDMVLNCDHIRTPQDVADIVLEAFKRKFAEELGTTSL